MTAWLDGAFVPAGALPPPPPHAISPFETMGARNAEVPLWDLHLARLSATAQRLGLPFAPAPALRAIAAGLLRQNGHADDVLRLTLVAGAPRPRILLETRARGPAGVVRLVPTVVERGPADPPGDVKAFPRTFYDAVRQQAQDAGADDGLVVDERGAVLETAVANVWLRLDGVWTTPPLDGRVLPGIGRALLLGHAAAAGLAVAEARCGLGDLHRAEALAVSNAVHGPRPARLLLGTAASTTLVDGELGALWRAATAGSSPVRQPPIAPA